MVDEQRYIRATKEGEQALAQYVYETVRNTLVLIATEKAENDGHPVDTDLVKAEIHRECHHLIDLIEDPPGKLAVRRMLEQTAAWVILKLRE